MKNILTFVFVLLFAAVAIKPALSQDIHFSQYYYSPVTLNPALTAVNKNLQATFQYKQQWGTVKAFSTGGATFEFKFNQQKWEKRKNLTDSYTKKEMKGLAIGFNFFSDKAGNGSIRQTMVNLSLAYHILLTRVSTLSAGLVGGYTQLSINPEGLRWNNQYSLGNYSAIAPSGETFAGTSLSYNDFGAGVLYSYENPESGIMENDQKHVDVGFAVSHINQPQMSFYDSGSSNLYRKYTAHASALFGLPGTKFIIGGSFLFMSQNQQKELTPGFVMKYRLKEQSNYTGYKKSSSLGLGLYYRAKDSFIPYLILELDKYSIGMSYDINTSDLTTATTGRGGFEVSLRFNTRSSFLYQNK